MTESNKPGATELKELMARVIDSGASEAFGEFMVRQLALSHMAPAADDAVLDGIEASPDGGAAMAKAHLLGLPDQEREELLERAAMETGRRLHAAAFALLAAVGAARLPVDVTPEMVAVAAITELGDSPARREVSPVVPKRILDELGLSAGQELELRTADGVLEVEVPATAMRLECQQGELVATADREMPDLPPDLVRETLERIRR